MEKIAICIIIISMILPILYLFFLTIKTHFKDMLEKKKNKQIYKNINLIIENKNIKPIDKEFYNCNHCYRTTLHYYFKNYG